MKYEYATYRDENENLCRLYSYELSNISISEKIRIRELILFDESEEYRLYPRFNKITPHFYRRSKNVRSYDRNDKDKSETHDDRIEELVEALKNTEELNIGYYRFEGKPKEDETKEEREKRRSFETLFKITDYSWAAESTRIVSSNLRVRHDVFGASKSHSMSERKPYVAIEVVRTHFPEKDTFEGLLSLSKQIPLLVVLNFTSKPNYFCQLLKNEKNSE